MLISAGSYLLALSGTLLFTLAVGFGAMLLLVPGVLAATRWIAVTPLIIERRDGVFASFATSASLTKGYRGRIFVTFMIPLGVAMVPAFYFAWQRAAEIDPSNLDVSVLMPPLSLVALQSMFGLFLVMLLGVTYQKLLDEQEPSHEAAGS